MKFIEAKINATYHLARSAFTHPIHHSVFTLNLGSRNFAVATHFRLAAARIPKIKEYKICKLFILISDAMPMAEAPAIVCTQKMGLHQPQLTGLMWRCEKGIVNRMAVLFFMNIIEYIYIAAEAGCDVEQR